jgi:hypothetical protein
VSEHLAGMFPRRIGPSGYNKPIRKASALFIRVIRMLATDTTLRSDDAWVVDSTLVECTRSRETVQRSDAAGWAQYGYGAAAPVRKGDALRAGQRLLKPLRQVIESVNWTFKGQLDLERHGGRTPEGIIARVLARILALTAAIWHNDNTAQPVKRSLIAFDH